MKKIKKIKFLDITLIVENNTVICNWFHKSTFSGRYLNFLSQHPFCQKKGTIIGLVDRCFMLSHPKYHIENIEFIIKILLNNGYPLKLIFDTINQRLKTLIYKLKHCVDKSDEEDRVTYFCVPYIPSLTDKFKRITNDLNVKLAYCSINKLNKYIKTNKDPVPKLSNNNVVYKIDCKDCDASYVGQTGRKLSTRVSEHRNHIRKNTTSNSVITDHRLNKKHDFKWDEVKILYNEPSYKKRLTSEMIHIKRQHNGLNLQTDIESLPDIYSNLIDRLPKI